MFFLELSFFGDKKREREKETLLMIVCLFILYINLCCLGGGPESMIPTNTVKQIMNKEDEK